MSEIKWQAVESEELVHQYVQALQALIAAGVNVRMMLQGRSVAVVVVGVEEEEGWLDIGYVESQSLCEKHVWMSLATRFTVVFDDWPAELMQLGWYR
jgi:hypothetical protein